MLQTRQGSNPQPPDHQWDEHPTEPPRLAVVNDMLRVFKHIINTILLQQHDLMLCIMFHGGFTVDTHDLGVFT